MNLRFSFIIPVYNRPQEIDELLTSFTQLNTNEKYEIVIIEDGSAQSSKPIIEKYNSELNIAYFEKENSGPGDSRNFGMQKASGNYFIILDSDVILPETYLVAAKAYLAQHPVDCFGGPDDAEQNFSEVQKAINMVMTSFLTTGGIRGKSKNIKSYEPRSFNMGLSKKAFEATGGFGNIHPGEDPELVIKLKRLGFKIGFIQKAFVYHKRRIDWQKFYQQVNKFGKVRPILNYHYPESKSLVFWFPSLFLLGSLIALFLAFAKIYLPLILLGIYLGGVFLEALFKYKSLKIAIYSLRALFIQFFGYGIGFLKSTLYIRVLKKKPETVFPNLFFKKK
ncbi:glycosyltransferase family 2 protein [Mesonia sp. K7]|uniref:glycosyltransferase n=1 Tax=Mesonia sp. K7 TaxID=2218606 RepID=UPI000DA84B3C|nr:glycosyltransferase [Mesonia sp. K7]PZD79559.1 glycosyl transferase family 2 [Mesonia sp. K7]